MKKLYFIGKTVYWLILIFLIFIAAFTAMSALNLPGNYKMFVVLSGSMEPKIKTGSIVVVRPQNDYKVGDVVSFKDFDKPRFSITHRIFSIKEENNAKVFTTKGDANKTPDPNEIRRGQILGKEIFTVPYAGYVINFTKTQTGLILLIVVPSVIIIYNELLSIKNETLRLLKERKKRKLSPKEKIEEKVGEEIIEAEKEIKKEVKKVKKVFKKNV